MSTLLYCWGSNQNSLLAPTAAKTIIAPQEFSLAHSVLAIAASEKHISFITSEGSLYSYGLNLDGRLGIGAKPDFKCTNPTKVKLPGRAVQIRCGFSHVCVVLSSREIYAWGLGDYGSLGTGEFKSRNTPAKVTLTAHLQDYSCGAMHSGFVDVEGLVYLCGSNQYGELGMNRPEKIATPTLLTFSQKATKIECGVFYTLLLTKRGQVYGMGNNKYGQLGIGHKVNECRPTLVRDLEDIVCIAAGYHSGALDSSGNLYLWGSGGFGELLKPKKYVLSHPLDCLYIRGFFGMAVSNRHESHVYSWGNNTSGELGRNSYESSKEPAEIEQLSHVQLGPIACGASFVVAVKLSDEHTTRSRRLRQYDEITLGEQVSKHLQRGFSFSPEQQDNWRKEAIEPIYHNVQRGADSNDYIRDTRRETPSRLNCPKEPPDSYIPSRSRSPVHAPTPARSRQKSVSSKIAPHQSLPQDYEQLFLKLSEDYEALLDRYNILEEQLQHKKRGEENGKWSQYQRETELKKRETELKKINIALQEELSRCQAEVTGLRMQGDKMGEEVRKSEDEVKKYKEEARMALAKSASLEEKLQRGERERTDWREAQAKFARIVSEKDSHLAEVTANTIKIQTQLLEVIHTLEQDKKELQEQVAQERQKHSNEIKAIQEQQYIERIAQEEVNREYRLRVLEDCRAESEKEHHVTMKEYRQTLQEYRGREEKYLREIEGYLARERSKEQDEQQATESNAGTIMKLQQLQQLNELRSEELKYQLEREQAQKNELLRELEVIRLSLSEEKKQFFRLIEEVRTNQSVEATVYKEKYAGLLAEYSASSERNKQLEVQLAYEKELNKRCQDTVREVGDVQDKVIKELEKERSGWEQERQKTKELSGEMEKRKEVQKEAKTLRDTLQKEREAQEEYKKEIESIVLGKEEIVRQLRQEIEKKQTALEEGIKKSEQELEGLGREKKEADKQLKLKAKETGELKKEIELREAQNVSLKDTIDKIERKIVFKTDQLEKESKEHELTSEQLTSLRRAQAKLKSQCDDLSRRLDQANQIKGQVEGRLAEKQTNILQLKQSLKASQEMSASLRKQGELARKELEEANWCLENGEKMKEELIRANMEFSENQEDLNGRIRQLQKKLEESEDQNRSYTPRYEALMQRNKQLDQRNNELSQIVNKAIEMQAQSYKESILKEVEVNTGDIIRHMKDEQVYHRRPKRQEEFREVEYEGSHGNQSLVEKVKDEPYTKMISEKINMHKKKVSESAHKLASILELEPREDLEDYKQAEGQSHGQFLQSKSVSLRKRPVDDYERVNEQMNSLSQQKSEFMSKINSFAEKLKIL